MVVFPGQMLIPYGRHIAKDCIAAVNRQKSRKKKAAKDSLAAADDSGSADDNGRGAAERLEELAVLEAVKDAEPAPVPAKRRSRMHRAVGKIADAPPAADDGSKSIPGGTE